MYPIWHYTLSVPVQSFLEEYDLGGKTVYAFTANAGSRSADSVGRIQEADPEAVVIEGLVVSEREMADAKDMVLKCVRDFNERPSASDQAEETEDIADMKNLIRSSLFFVLLLAVLSASGKTMCPPLFSTVLVGACVFLLRSYCFPTFFLLFYVL